MPFFGTSSQKYSYRMNIGASIKEFRIQKNISQSEFANKCGISQTSISQIENGVKRPNPGNLKKICKILEIPETVLYLKALEESDIPDNKREMYREFFPIVENMLRKLTQ